MDKSEKNGNVDNNVSVFTFRPYVGQSVHVGIFFLVIFLRVRGLCLCRVASNAIFIIIN